MSAQSIQQVPSAEFKEAAQPSPRPLSPITATSEAHLAELVGAHARVALNFCADWAAPCTQMNSVFAALAEASVDPVTYPDPLSRVLFVTVPAEELPVTAAEYRVATVPYFVLLSTGRVAARIEGANPPLLAKKVEWLATAPAPILEKETLVEATKEDEIMLFMKGSPDQPKCGFSRQIVEMLRKSGVVFGHRDILKDQWLREELKKLHNWPTYPQLYARGRLIGGLDIVRELVDTGELVDELSRDEPEDQDQRASDSRQDADRGANNGLMNSPVETVAAGDRETEANGRSVVPPTANEVSQHVPIGNPSPVDDGPTDLNHKLRAIVSRSPIMLFMKGHPDTPRCGFSKKIVALLREQGLQFDSFDILEDPEVRQGLKVLFSWPTYPQLYSKGELIGGLDIVQDLAESGSLKEELGLAS
jgi:Grx4 family monothiol glutaredoxin